MNDGVLLVGEGGGRECKKCIVGLNCGSSGI